MTASIWARSMRWIAMALVVAVLASCSSGPVRRVSEPSARIQQLTVRADGNWETALRIENFSSIPMRFETVDLVMNVDGHVAGSLRASPALSVGPESAEVVSIVFAPAAAAKLAVADALAGRRSIAYTLKGRMTAIPEKGTARDFAIDRNSELSPAPGLAGVLR